MQLYPAPSWLCIGIALSVHGGVRVILLYTYIFILSPQARSSTSLIVPFSDCSLKFHHVTCGWNAFCRIFFKLEITNYNYQFPNQGIYKCHHSKAFPNLYLLSISMSEAVPSYSSFGSQAIAHLVANWFDLYSCNKNISDEDFLLQLKCFLDEKRNNKAQ